MFSDSQAILFVGKKLRIILPVTKIFTNDFFYQPNFMPTFFSDKVIGKISNHQELGIYMKNNF